MMGSSVSSKSSRTFSSTSNAFSCENTGLLTVAASSAVVVVVGLAAPATASPVTLGGEVALLLEALREKAFLKRSKARPKLFRLAARSVADGSWGDIIAGQFLIADGCQFGGIMAFANTRTGEEVAAVERIPGNR